MKEKELIELNRRGEIPLVLLALWRARRHEDPIRLAELYVKHDRRVFIPFISAIILIAPLFIVWFGSVITSVMISWDPLLDIDFLSWVSAIFPLGGLGVVCMVAAFILNYWPGAPPTSFFDLRLEAFRKLACESYSVLSKMTQAELEALATKILVNHAREVLQLAIDFAGVPKSHWEARKLHLENDFENAYGVLHDLGIAGGPYKKFYDLARREGFTLDQVLPR